MTKPYDPHAVVQVLVPLTAVINHAKALGFTSQDLIAMLQAGRLSAVYVDRPEAERHVTFPEFEALFSISQLLMAEDRIHEQLSRARRILVAMGKLVADDGH